MPLPKVNANRERHDFSVLILEIDSGGKRQISAVRDGRDGQKFLFVNQSRRRLPAPMQCFGGSGGILVAIDQVPELRRRLQWLRRPMINSAYEAIDGSTLTASLCRFTVFC
jgi:hypothetical protein